MNGQKRKVVDKFTYLGSALYRAVHIDDEITARTAKASVVFGRLRANFLERNANKLDSKLSLQCCGTANTRIRMRDLDTDVMQSDLGPLRSVKIFRVFKTFTFRNILLSNV